MKKKKHIEEAERIGNDTWELQNFTQLPENASKERQIEALKADQRWMQNHVDTFSHCIDMLIHDIEFGS